MAAAMIAHQLLGVWIKNQIPAAVIAFVHVSPFNQKSANTNMNLDICVS